MVQRLEAKMSGWWLVATAMCGLCIASGEALAEETDSPPLLVPQLLGAQYTGIDQHQFSLRSPYAGKLSST
jgi:hypothetical protein